MTLSDIEAMDRSVLTPAIVSEYLGCDQQTLRLLSFSSTPSIRTLSTILKNGQDLAQKEPEVQKSSVQHGITRGADYFRKGGNSR